MHYKYSIIMYSNILSYFVMAGYNQKKLFIVLLIVHLILES